MTKALKYFTICILINSCNQEKLKVFEAIADNKKIKSEATIENGKLCLSTKVNNKLSGVQYTFDSLNIIREISWYHEMDSPFAYRRFDHLYYNEWYVFNKRYLDTSLIKTPIINYKELFEYKYIEIIYKDYPAEFVGVGITNNNETNINFKTIGMNNSLYIQYTNTDDRDLIFDFIYRDNNDVVVKEIKSIVVKNPNSRKH